MFVIHQEASDDDELGLLSVAGGGDFASESFLAPLW